jgi:hypothetical protein
VPTIEVFYSYAHNDERLRDELHKHLTPLQRQRFVRHWYDRKITAGSNLNKEIDKHLETADLILLLISSDFIASEYCYTIEMVAAFKRHAKGSVRVVPVILRDCDWHKEPFAKLLVVPKDGRAVTSWPNPDEAFADAARSIRKVVEELIEQRKQELVSLGRKMTNPNYKEDLSALEQKQYDLSAVLNKQTVIIVVGDQVIAELLDRPVAARVRDEIDKIGAGLPGRRAIIVGYHTWIQEKRIQGNPVISIGGPVMNELTKELAAANQYQVASGVHGSFVNRSGILRVARWGVSASETWESVRIYIDRPDGLREFLRISWPK